MLVKSTPSQMKTCQASAFSPAETCLKKGDLLMHGKLLVQSQVLFYLIDADYDHTTLRPKCATQVCRLHLK